jgi:hypothetical protein
MLMLMLLLLLLKPGRLSGRWDPLFEFPQFPQFPQLLPQIGTGVAAGAPESATRAGDIGQGVVRPDDGRRRLTAAVM